MHPALIFFIILIVLTVVIAIGYFGYKHFHISEECSLLGDTLEFLELYNPASFDDKEIKIFEKMTPNERKQKLEDLRKKMAENKANNLANNIR